MPMPKQEDFLKKEYFETILADIQKRIYTVKNELEITVWTSREPLLWKERKSGKKRTLKIGDSWGGLFDCGWFCFKGCVPEVSSGEEAVLRIDINGELCIVDAEGIPVRGLTTGSSVYDYRSGKQVYSLPERFPSGEVFEIWADAGANDLFGVLRNEGRIIEAFTAVCRLNLLDVFYDLDVCIDALSVLDQSSARYATLRNSVIQATEILMSPRGNTDDFIEKAKSVLRKEMKKKGGDPSLVISAIGHAHIDLAWLWPIRETIRKGARTFSTVLDLMEKYPHYIYGASQPQLYVWMKEFYPELFSRIKKRVDEGRIELLGAMWVEADTNLSGGESIVRQILYGKRYFRKEFSQNVDFLWLPDTFGYSGALPQILKKAGVYYFFTQKLSWSRINTFPHHSFVWKGIDGSSILVHMFPENTYNSPAAPRSAVAVEKNYHEKDISSSALMVYGIGDGGGGPGEEHLERLLRIRDFSGISPVKQERVDEFIGRWERDSRKFCMWEGELFLEFHHGTYTTQGKVKRWNRRMEMALRELEILSSFVSVLMNGVYPENILQSTWKEVLLYQFHDILPGSSIKRVYEECLYRYDCMYTEILDVVNNVLRNLGQNINSSEFKDPFLVFNVLSWKRRSVVSRKGKQFLVDLPAMGYTVIEGADSSPTVSSELKAAKGILENDLLTIRFQENGALSSLFDKEAKRELVPSGTMANQFRLYRDTGDAWDFMPNYREEFPDAPVLVRSVPCVKGFSAFLVQYYKYGSSRILQKIEIVYGSKRVDFSTKVDWNTPEIMLKTSFPLTLQVDYAQCEIQFGSIKRPVHSNTSWDLAKDEVPAQKWVDLSDGNYGAALLNNGKYGYRVKDSAVELTLLRSVAYPSGPEASVMKSTRYKEYSDLGRQSFTYSFYPHRGTFASGGVVEQGYELNQPLRVVPLDIHEGLLPPEYSLFKMSEEGIIIETVKKAEDSGCFIVRMYESYGRAKTVILTSPWKIRAAFEVDLMEENPAPLLVRHGSSLVLSFHLFEIKTLKIKME